MMCRLWYHWAHCGTFENGVLLMYTLEGVSSIAHFIMSPTSKKLEGHIASGLFVRPSVLPSVRHAF